MRTFLLVAVLVTLPMQGQAIEYELESCQFISQSVPPGLDEPLNCDHKCFYVELGIMLLDDRRPDLHDMYSIGWRLLDIVEVTIEKRVIWTLYLERETSSRTNDCDETYAPKRPTAANSGNDS